MKAFLRLVYICFFAALAMPKILMAQKLAEGDSFIDHAIWWIVPTLAVFVIILMIRNKRRRERNIEE